MEQMLVFLTFDDTISPEDWPTLLGSNPATGWPKAAPQPAGDQSAMGVAVQTMHYRANSRNPI